jgi:hypothetical protein
MTLKQIIVSINLWIISKLTLTNVTYFGVRRTQRSHTVTATDRQSTRSWVRSTSISRNHNLISILNLSIWLFCKHFLSLSQSYKLNQWQLHKCHCYLPCKLWQLPVPRCVKYICSDEPSNYRHISYKFHCADSIMIPPLHRTTAMSVTNGCDDVTTTAYSVCIGFRLPPRCR